MSWYQYNGGNICDPNNYILLSAAPSCPTPNEILCAIQATDNMGSPTLTFSLLCEIGNAMVNRSESTNVRLKPF